VQPELKDKRVAKGVNGIEEAQMHLMNLETLAEFKVAVTRPI
jgi:hypothetical protein